jgi:hypothetical protein
MDADADAMRGSCAPACDQGQRDALSSKLVAANVSLGIGLALLAGAAVTWILTPSSTHTSTRNASR